MDELSLHFSFPMMKSKYWKKRLDRKQDPSIHIPRHALVTQSLQSIASMQRPCFGLKSRDFQYIPVIILSW